MLAVAIAFKFDALGLPHQLPPKCVMQLHTLRLARGLYKGEYGPLNRNSISRQKALALHHGGIRAANAAGACAESAVSFRS